MTPITKQQLATIQRQRGDKSPKQLAKELGLSRRQVEEALAQAAAAPRPNAEPLWLLFVGAVLVVVLAVAGYSNNLTQSEFHFDDLHSIEKNDAIKTLYRKVNKDARTDLSSGQRTARFLQKHGETAQAIYDYNLYRMVSYWSFAYTYYDHPFDEAKTRAEWNEHLAGWHAANNRIHFLNGLLALWLAWVTLTAPAFKTARRAIRYPIAAAILAAVVFATHPLQTQAVTYLSQRSEALCATFYLLGLALYGTARKRSLRAEVRGSAPWMTPLVLGAAGFGMALAAVAAAKTDVLGAGGFVKLSLFLVAAAVAGVVALVKTRRDEWVHAACTVGAFAAFAFGLQSKEIAATMPVAFCLWDLFFVPGAALGAGTSPSAGQATGRAPWCMRALQRGFMLRVRYLGPWAGIVGGVALIAVVFGGANIASQLAEGVEEGGQAAGVMVGPGSYFMTELNVFWTYLRMFFLPVGQTLDHDYPTVAFAMNDGATWLSLLSGLLLAGALGLVAWRGGRARVPAFALLLALIVLAPTSTIIVLPDVIYEHRYYLPLFGVALALAVSLERVVQRLVPGPQQLIVLGSLTLALGVGLTTLTRARNEVWQTEATLWEDAAEKSPGKPRTWTNLGLYYMNRAPYELVVRTPDGKSTSVLGSFAQLPDGTTLVLSTQDMGVKPIPVPPGAVLEIKERGGGPDAALTAFGKALEVDPDYSKALNNLSLILINQADNNLWIAQALAQLAQVYQQQGEQAGLEACVQAQNNHLRARGLAVQRAEQVFLRIVGLEPDDAVLWSNLGNFYATQRDDLHKAYECVSKSLSLDGPIEGHATCATIQFMLGNDAYRAATDATQDPLQAAEPFWQRAKDHYRSYLLSPDPKRVFQQEARQGLDKLERYLRGEAGPPLEDSQVPDGVPDGHSADDGHGH